MATKESSQGEGKGCIITLFSIGALLPTLLGLLAIIGMNAERIPAMPSLWLMLRSYIVVFPLAWTGFLTGYYYKPLIGGVLLILIGLITIAGPFVVANMYNYGALLDLDALYFFPLAVFIGFGLLISGYSFIKSMKAR